MLKTIHEFKNKTQFVHEETNYDCLMIWDSGSYSIFVGLPPRHEYWKEDYNRINAIENSRLDYSSFCEHTDEENGICHVPIKDKGTKVWWVGERALLSNGPQNIMEKLELLAFQMKYLEG